MSGRPRVRRCCLRWVKAPAGVAIITRLVCCLPCGHHGAHHAYRWSWTDSDRTPRETILIGRRAS